MATRTPEQKQTIQVWTAIIFRGILITLALLALFFYALPWLYETLKTVLLMLVISVFFCYLVAPLVRIFEQPIYLFGREIKLPRVAAIGVVYLIFAAVGFVALRLLLPLLWVQLALLAKNSPEYANQVVAWSQRAMDDASTWMRQLRLPPDLRRKILDEVQRLALESQPKLSSVITGIFNSLSYVLWLVLIPILSFFMLKDAERAARGLAALMPSERLQKRMYWLLLDVSRTLAAYIRAQITACVVVFGIVTTGLTIMGVDYAVVLGVVSGILEFVPMVGPIVGAAVTIGLAFTTSAKTAFAVAIFLAVMRVVQDYVIYPRIVGHGIKMHPFVIVLAILCGEKIGGLVGIFLAIPFVGLIIVFYNHYLAYKTLSASAAAAEAAKSRELPFAQQPPAEAHLGEPVLAAPSAGEK
ncbi:MAG TPA: AI-2E family transporter [Blastocatellia bacterium]|nr:AI-2E family transporter [Blastocatellia bacterium]